jgi:hypothetical protein
LSKKPQDNKKYFLKEKKIRASSGIYWKAFDEWDFLELV